MVKHNRRLMLKIYNAIMRNKLLNHMWKLVNEDVSDSFCNHYMKKYFDAFSEFYEQAFVGPFQAVKTKMQKVDC